MARAPRVEFKGAWYHVIDRGVERRRIFGIDGDYVWFLSLCGELARRYRVRLLAYCLLPNHYHLLLETEMANLRRFMQELNGRYSQHFNRRCRRSGPLFQGRYRALLVQDDPYALAVARYIHRNPVEAGLADRPERYPWSSYREFMGKAGSSLVDEGRLLGMLPGSLAERRRRIDKFTTGEDEFAYSPDRAKGNVIVGDQEFVDWVRREKVARRRARGTARWPELARPGAGLDDSLKKRVAALTDDPKLGRKLFVYALRRSTPLSLAEIARKAGMRTIVAVSQTVRRLERERRDQSELAGLLERLDEHLRGGQ